VKSMLTVNTSGIAQAVVGGMLVENDFSLRTANRHKIDFYRRNMEKMLGALDCFIPVEVRNERGIRWNVPDGGFFAVVTVPGLDAGEKLLEISAQEHGVIWTPMRFFYGNGEGGDAIRLSCSWLEPSLIEEGIRRLAGLIMG